MMMKAAIESAWSRVLRLHHLSTHHGPFQWKPPRRWGAGNALNSHMRHIAYYSLSIRADCKSQQAHACPSCGQQCFRPVTLQRHLQRCCPDHISHFGIDTQTFNFGDDAAVEEWLQRARGREEELREKSVRSRAHKP